MFTSCCRHRVRTTFNIFGGTDKKNFFVNPSNNPAVTQSMGEHDGQNERDMRTPHPVARRPLRRFGGRVVLVERRALVAESLAYVFANAGVAVGVIREATSETVEREISAYEPDLIMVGVEGQEQLPMIRACAESSAPVLVFTDSEDRLTIAQCIEAGAIGTVNTSEPVDGLLETVHDAITGSRVLSVSAETDLLLELRQHERETEQKLRPFSNLSGRESEVLAAMMQGLSAAQIAEDSFVSVATIRSQIKAILRKLGVNSQLAAVAQAYQAGWSPEAHRIITGKQRRVRAESSVRPY